MIVFDLLGEDLCEELGEELGEDLGEDLGDLLSILYYVVLQEQCEWLKFAPSKNVKQEKIMCFCVLEIGMHLH